MADKTALFESSQALLCAVADYIGADKSNIIFDEKKYDEWKFFKAALLKHNSNALKEAARRTHTPGVSPSQVEEFLEDDKKWYASTIKVAKKIVNDIRTVNPGYKIRQKGFHKVFYYRGDQKVMGNIEALFKVANKSAYTSQVKFGNVNKWCPADMYFATDKSVRDIQTELREAKVGVYSFQHLNVFMSDLIDSGHLLPLSLKKVEKKEPELKKVNYDKKEEIKFLKKVKVKSVSPWKPYKKVKWGTPGETKSMQVFLETGGFIKIRHDPSAKRFVAEVIFGQASARAGSIGSIEVFCQMLAYVDRGLSSRLMTAFRNGEQKYYKDVKPYEVLRKSDKKRYDFERLQISGLHVTNAIMPMLKTFFERKDSKANGFVGMVFQYITSRTPLSGKFVIAK